MRLSRNFFTDADPGVPSPGAGGQPEPQPEETPAWFSQLPKESRETYKDLAKYKSIDELAKYASRKDPEPVQPDYTGYLKMPTEESTSEELKDFLSKLGVPESADKYTLPEEKDNGYYAALQKTLREQAFRSGLSDKQAIAMWGVVRAMTDTAQNQAEAYRKDRIDNFDTRYEGLFHEQFPQKAQRDSAIKESLGYFSTFLAETGLGKVFEETGTLYDERIVKAISEYQKKVRGKYTPGQGGTHTDDKRSTKMSYSDSFYKEFGG